MKTVDEIFAELASMKWKDPTHEYLNRMVTVTFIDLTNCDEDDFASEPPVEVVGRMRRSTFWWILTLDPPLGGS